MRFVGSAAGSWWINDWMAITIFNVFVQVNGFVFRLFRPSHIHHNQLFITPLHGLHVCLRPDTLHERMRSRRWRRERERGARQLKLTETCRASEVCVPQVFFFYFFHFSFVVIFQPNHIVASNFQNFVFLEFVLFFLLFVNRRAISIPFRAFVCAPFIHSCSSGQCAITADDDDVVAIVVILHPERTAWTSQHHYTCIHCVTQSRMLARVWVRVKIHFDRIHLNK